MLLAYEAHDAVMAAGLLELRLRGDLIPAIRAGIVFLKPFLDAVVTKNVLALGQSQRSLLDALWSFDAKVIVADDAA
jgi:hypothetical protein